MQNRNVLSPSTINKINQAVAEHRLPAEFSTEVIHYYVPLAHQLYTDISARAEADQSSGVQFIGIQGSQGSGKSTCADFLKTLLQAQYGLRVLVASIDDFYLTLREREKLAESVHPLLITRGVPGTHDVSMLNAMFDCAERGESFAVPNFSKAEDDRAPIAQWQQVQGALDVVILEGWCVGLSAQDNAKLRMPINQLEMNEDATGQWRALINHHLETDYCTLFARLDHLVALQAPSFECVFDWRLLQEQKMIARLSEQDLDVSGAQTPAQLKRFIAHYQRLTEHALESMPTQADYLLWLNKNHGFVKLQRVPQ